MATNGQLNFSANEIDEILTKSNKSITIAEENDDNLYNLAVNDASIKSASIGYATISNGAITNNLQAQNLFINTITPCSSQVESEEGYRTIDIADDTNLIVNGRSNIGLYQGMVSVGPLYLENNQINPYRIILQGSSGDVGGIHALEAENLNVVQTATLNTITVNSATINSATITGDAAINSTTITYATINNGAVNNNLTINGTATLNTVSISKFAGNLPGMNINNAIAIVDPNNISLNPIRIVNNEGKRIIYNVDDIGGSGSDQRIGNIYATTATISTLNTNTATINTLNATTINPSALVSNQIEITGLGLAGSSTYITFNGASDNTSFTYTEDWNGKLLIITGNADCKLYFPATSKHPYEFEILKLTNNRVILDIGSSDGYYIGNSSPARFLELKGDFCSSYGIKTFTISTKPHAFVSGPEIQNVDKEFLKT